MMNKNCITRPPAGDLSIICDNIATALSIIYSRRLNMKIVFDCIPKKGGENNGRNECSDCTEACSPSGKTA